MTFGFRENRGEGGREVIRRIVVGWFLVLVPIVSACGAGPSEERTETPTREEMEAAYLQWKNHVLANWMLDTATATRDPEAGPMSDMLPDATFFLIEKLCADRPPDPGDEAHLKRGISGLLSFGSGLDFHEFGHIGTHEGLERSVLLACEVNVDPAAYYRAQVAGFPAAYERYVRARAEGRIHTRTPLRRLYSEDLHVIRRCGIFAFPFLVRTIRRTDDHDLANLLFTSAGPLSPSIAKEALENPGWNAEQRFGAVRRWWTEVAPKLGAFPDLKAEIEREMGE